MNICSTAGFLEALSNRILEKLTTMKQSALAIPDCAALSLKGENRFRVRHITRPVGIKGPSARTAITDRTVLRIAESFIKMNQDQARQPQGYQVGGIWEGLAGVAHLDFCRALESKDIEKISHYFNNFGTDRISLGISLSGGIPTTFFQKLRFANWMNRNHSNWKRLTALPEEFLEYPANIGNLPGAVVDGRLIIQPSHRLSFFAQRIFQMLRTSQRGTVCEIGGGFGGIGYHLNKNFGFAGTWMNFDIPEVLAISSWFILNAFPDKKALMYGEGRLTAEIIRSHDIVLMPNFAIQDLPDLSVDLVFNSHSMTEMDYSTVKEYVSQINRVCRQYFLHANHEYGADAAYYTPAGKLKNHINMNDPEFELPHSQFRRIYRFPEIIQNDGREYPHNLYWEYLYERSTS